MTPLAGVPAGTNCSAEGVAPSSVTGFLRSVQAGTSGWSDLAQCCIDRIARREPVIHAWSYHDPQVIRRQLDEFDRLGDLPLKGIPIGLKDIFDTSEMPTSYGSAIYAGHYPLRDAEVVRRLKAAGAVIAGKTVTTEFAYIRPGPTVNPHAAGHTPGGSSSGSAAAVADGMVPLALGSQTGGSTIRPAAFCGIVGFKPTYGLISTAGMKSLAPSMDTVGIHARCVADLALILPALGGPSFPVDRLIVRRAIVWFPGPHGGDADEDARAALQAARELLLSTGYAVESIELADADIAGVGEANRIIMAYEAARSLAHEYREHRAQISEASALLVEAGQRTSEGDYRKALERAARGRAILNDRLAGRLLMTFPAPGEAPRIQDGTGNSMFNRAWTAMGLPCMTLPFGRGRRFGLPLGIQFVAASGQDQALIEGCEGIQTLFEAHAFGQRC
jgi:Asp-tRNA(Asn)/Glu-tRNA(Gln) amidotransferase A subunit family amidase